MARRRFFPGYRWLLAENAILQSFIILLAGATLDGGHLFHFVLFNSAVYWLSTAMVVFRRPRYPTRVDIYCLRYGFLMLIVGELLFVFLANQLCKGAV